MNYFLVIIVVLHFIFVMIDARFRVGSIKRKSFIDNLMVALLFGVSRDGI